MALTRINNDQISNAISGNSIVGIVASDKLQDGTVTSAKLETNITVAGNITAGGAFVGNGAGLTNVPGANYSDANVEALLSDGTLTSNITTTGNLSIGNSAQFGSSYVTANSAGFFAGVTGAGGISTLGGTTSIGGTGGVSIIGVAGATVNIGNPTGGDVNITRHVEVSNTVTAINFYGDGSGLTGIISSYGDANVEALLESGTLSNNIITTGNIFANTFVATDAANVAALRLSGTTLSINPESAEQHLYVSPNGESWAYLDIPVDEIANTANLRIHNDAGNIEFAAGDFSTGSNIYYWNMGGDGVTTFPDNTVTTGATVTTPVGDTYAINTSQYIQESADAIAGSGVDTFIADTSSIDDITAVQVGWEFDSGSGWLSVTAVDGSVPDQYSITVPGFTFVDGNNYLFRNPVPATNTWSINQQGVLSLPGNGTISQLNNDLFVAVAGTDIIGLRTDGGDVIFDAQGNLNIPANLVSTTSVSRLSLNETGIGDVYLTSTDDNSTAVLMNTTGIQEYAGITVDIVAGTMLPGLETDYTDAQIILEDAFTQNSAEPGYPWGITLPTSYLTYSEIILLAPGTFPNQVAVTAQALNTQNLYELWQNTITETNVTITANENNWVFDAAGSLTAPGNIHTANVITADYFVGNGLYGNETDDTAVLGNASGLIQVYTQSNGVGIQTYDTPNLNYHTWSFAMDGNLYLPDGDSISINYANGQPYGGGGGAGPDLINGTNSFSLDSSALAILTLSNVGGPKGSIQGRSDNPDILIDSYTGNVILSANDSREWNFGIDGNLTIPSGGDINFVNTGGITQAVNNDLRFTVSDDEADGWAIQSTVDDGAGNDLTRMQVRYDGIRINTDIPTNNYSWDFRESGEFDVPKSIRGPVGGNLVISIGDQFGVGPTFIDLQTISHVGDALISNIRIGDPNVTVSTSSGAQNWTFDGSGILQFPRDVVGNTDPYLTIEGGSNPGITSTDVSLTGPANLGISANYTNFSGFNGNTVSIYADDGAISASANLVLTADSSNTAQNWTFDNTGILTVPGEGIIQSLNDTVILQSVDTGTGNIVSARFGTNGGLYFEGTEYPTGWLSLTNNAGNADVTAASGTAGSGEAGKNINITAGSADLTGYYTTTGGNVNLYAGLGATDDGGGGGQGGSVNIVSGNSADPAGVAGNVNISAGSNNWLLDNTGTTTLPTVSSESAKFVGTRKVVGGLTAGAPYSVTLNAGGTPTVAYTSLAGTSSVKVTFAVASNGAGYQWEQFDVIATPSQDVSGEVNFVVSNRVKGAASIADTVVTATMNVGQIQISLTLDAAQTSGGTASFDATEFGLMVD